MNSHRIAAAAFLTIVMVGAAVLWRWPPVQSGWYPPCPTRALLGFYCPGCGSTRACGALVAGRLSAAWRFNPLLVAVGVPLLGYAAARAAFVLWRGQPPRWRWGLPARSGFVFAAALVLYGIARNIPAEQLDWLRPPEDPARVMIAPPAVP